MNKVYFDKSPTGKWLVLQLEDMYSFKYLTNETNEKNNAVLTWVKARNEEFHLIDDVRLYSVDLFDEEYLFYIKYIGGERYEVNSIDVDKLEDLKVNKGITFIGSEMVEDVSN